MAVFATTVTVGTSSAVTTLTGWAPFVSVTVPSGAAGPVFVTTDGSTAVTTGVDSIACAVGATTYLRNHSEAPELTTTIPGAFDPSAVAKQTTTGTAIGTIAGASTAGVVLTLAHNAGNVPVLG